MKMAEPQKASVDWMYQGPESIVNKEDYLLGKTLDKNFELYSGDVAKEPSSKIAAVTEKSVTKINPDDAYHFKHTMLDMDTVRKEDPLVAIKVREEKVRREILDNPMRMKRFQKIVMAAMRKKMKKMVRELDSSSSSSASEDEDPRSSERGRRKREKPKEEMRREGAKTNRHELGNSSRSNQDHRNGRDEPSRRDERNRRFDRETRRERESPDRSKRSHYEQRRGSPNGRRRLSPEAKRRRRSSSGSDSKRKRQLSPPSKRDEKKEEVKRAKEESSSSSSSTSSSSDSEPETKNKRVIGPTLGPCDYSASDSDEERKKKKYSGFGLVKTKDYQSPDRSEKSEHRSFASRIPEALAKFNPSYHKTKRTELVQKKERLTAEEKEAKLREMRENAKWRDEQRANVVKKLERREKEEEEEERRKHKGDTDSFIRPMLAKVADSTVEARVKSNRRNLQRGHNDMNRHFARK